MESISLLMGWGKLHHSKIDKQKRARDGGRVWYTPPLVYVGV